MGKFDGVLLVSDYDDTLYNSRLEVSDGNRRAIEYFIGEGGWFTVATGRAHDTFTPQIAKERIPFNAPVILSNGAAIYDYGREEYLHRSVLGENAPAHMTELMAAIPELGFESYHEGIICVHNPNLVSWSHLERVGAKYTVCTHIADMTTPWTKLILEQDYPVLEKAQRMIAEKWGHLYEAIFSNRYLLEVTAKNNTKGALVTKLAGMLGAKPEHIYCIGDNQNDIPMLAVSAIPFAPDNCSEEVKAWGARLVGHCDDDAVARVIEILDGIY